MLWLRTIGWQTTASLHWKTLPARTRCGGSRAPGGVPVSSLPSFGGWGAAQKPSTILEMSEHPKVDHPGDFNCRLKKRTIITEFFYKDVSLASLP